MYQHFSIANFCGESSVYRERIILEQYNILGHKLARQINGKSTKYKSEYNKVANCHVTKYIKCYVCVRNVCTTTTAVATSQRQQSTTAH